LKSFLFLKKRKPLYSETIGWKIMLLFFARSMETDFKEKFRKTNQKRL